MPYDVYDAFFSLMDYRFLAPSASSSSGGAAADDDDQLYGGGVAAEAVARRRLRHAQLLPGYNHGGFNFEVRLAMVWWHIRAWSLTTRA